MNTVKPYENIVLGVNVNLKQDSAFTLVLRAYIKVKVEWCQTSERISIYYVL